MASEKYRTVFVTALLREIVRRKDYLADKIIQSVYFGGGTPSLLSVREINQILEQINSNFTLDTDAEITLEANPDDLDADKLKALKNETAVNRLSMGVQSFFDNDLHYLNRVHSGKQAVEAIEAALEQQFSNLTIDLIYGIPTLTLEKWQRNLEIFLSFDLPHLSAYSLTVEPKTALNTLIRKNKARQVDEAQSVRHFQLLLDETSRNNYIHYEISNFARPGHYSGHNSIYWVGGHYLGLGPSAHSFNGFSRQWNVSSMKQYIDADSPEKTVFEKEILTTAQQYNEYVMTALRTSWGCDSGHIVNVFGTRYRSHFEDSIRQFVSDGRIEQKGNVYLLTAKGKLFADGISAALFSV
ncbi:MAG: radical SAM family heme chaperone HemW [Bacteroidales bacterium]|nr:radical SAM family heme chaperone HemW [Bacteroidales bacterium]